MKKLIPFLQKTHAPLYVGCLVRNKGNGASVMEVIAIRKDVRIDNDVVRREYYSVMLKSWGTVKARRVKRTSQPVTIHARQYAGLLGVAAVRGTYATWSYEHVNINL